MSNEFSLPYISAHEVEAAFPLAIAMETQREVFSAFDRGEAVMGKRGVIPNGTDASFAYVARSSPNGPTIVKFGSVTNSNAARNLPVVHAYISILDSTTGAIGCFIDGESVTRIRTTAASMVAAQQLASQTQTIAVVGAGIQGIAHARAALELFSPERLLIVTRTSSSEAHALASEFPQIEIIHDIEVALREADLIFLCTNAISPVVNSPLRKGITIISIGSFSPNREEISGAVVSQADLIFGDDSQTIQTQSGSIISGLLVDAHLDGKITSLGALLNNPSLGRKNLDQVILYFSVGLGIQDAAIVEKYFKLKKI